MSIIADDLELLLTWLEYLQTLYGVETIEEVYELFSNEEDEDE